MSDQGKALINALKILHRKSRPAPTHLVLGDLEVELLQESIDRIEWPIRFRGCEVIWSIEPSLIHFIKDLPYKWVSCHEPLVDNSFS